jgi:hypothetical protein
MRPRLAVIALFFGASTAGWVCTACVAQPVTSYCCTLKNECGDQYRECLPDSPERPFCDNHGEYPASQGVSKTCIPTPMGACATSVDCTADSPVCGTAQHCEGCVQDVDCSRYAPTLRCGKGGTCVECLNSNDCLAAESPVCDGSTATCRVCKMDEECKSGICEKATGLCMAEEKILYVDTAGGATPDCSRASPCKTIQQAIDDVDGFRSWVHVAPGTYSGGFSVSGKAVQIVANGAELGQGFGIEVTGSATVSIEGLGVTGSASAAVSCSKDAQGHAPTLALIRMSMEPIGYGVVATGCALDLREVTITGSGGDAIYAINGGSLSVARSTITGSKGFGIVKEGGSLTLTETTLADGASDAIQPRQAKVAIARSRIVGKEGCGVSLSGSDFVIVNNFVARNRAPGILIWDSPPSGALGAILEFNTVVDNVATGHPGGVECRSVTVPLAFQNNIVYGNTGGTQVGTQVGGANCTWAYSDVGPDGVLGTGIINMMPKFVDTSTNNYHLSSGSPGIDAANPAVGAVSVDIDGETRPEGVRADIGADEVH